VGKKIFKKIAKVATGGLIGGAAGLVGAALGNKKKAAAEPSYTNKIGVMPTADDEAVRRAKKKALAERMSAGGRTSTMLSDSSDTLG